MELGKLEAAMKELGYEIVSVGPAYTDERGAPTGGPAFKIVVEPVKKD